MKEKKHHARIEAERAHKKALETLALAESQPSEAIFTAAWNAAGRTRKALVEQELLHPTHKEIRAHSRELSLRNRGLDI